MYQSDCVAHFGVKTQPQHKQCALTNGEAIMDHAFGRDYCNPLHRSTQSGQ